MHALGALSGRLLGVTAPAQTPAIGRVEESATVTTFDDMVSEETHGSVALASMLAASLALPSGSVQNLQAPCLVGLGLKLSVGLLRERPDRTGVEGGDPGG